MDCATCGGDRKVSLLDATRPPTNFCCKYKCYSEGKVFIVILVSHSTSVNLTIAYKYINRFVVVETNASSVVLEIM